jgi:hypothetical protein
MSALQKSIAGVLGLLLAAVAYGLWATDEPPAPVRVAASARPLRPRPASRHR